MTSFDYKKIPLVTGRGFSVDRVVKYLILIFCAITIVVIAADAVIFSKYYRIAVKPAEPPQPQAVSVSRDILQRVFELVERRESP